MTFECAARDHEMITLVMKWRRFQVPHPTQSC